MGRIGLVELLIVLFLVVAFLGVIFSSGWGCAVGPRRRRPQLHPADVGRQTPRDDTSSGGGMADTGLRLCRTKAF